LPSGSIFFSGGVILLFKKVEKNKNNPFQSFNDLIIENDHFITLSFLQAAYILTLKVDCRRRKMAPALSDILRITASLLVLMLLMFCMGAINLEAQDVSLAPDEGTYIYF